VRLNAGVGVRACARVHSACCVSTSGECKTDDVSCDRECSLFAIRSQDYRQFAECIWSSTNTPRSFIVNLRYYWRLNIILVMMNFNISCIAYSTVISKRNLHSSFYIFAYRRNEIIILINYKSMWWFQILVAIVYILYLRATK